MKLYALKPDEIGDFVLSLGCLHLLADHVGDEQMGLAVKADSASLARREFPRAEIFPLVLHRRERGEATGFRNFAAVWPSWWRLRRRKVGIAACLRARRTFLHSLLLLAPPANRRGAVRNPADPKLGRRMMEWILHRVFRVGLVPYPEPAPGRPTELEAHRRLASLLLGRDVGWEEVLPRFRTASWRGGGGFWLLCPFSSRRMKDYSATCWAAALGAVSTALPPGGVRLAGGPDQHGRLEAFANDLRGGGFTGEVRVETPVPLEHFPEVVAAADLVLTVDTAAAHFAAALGAPAVVVSCGLHPGVYGPYSRDGRQRWLVGDWAALGAKGWPSSVPPSSVAEEIRRVLEV